MARLLDALMHPVSQIVLLIGIIGLSGFFIFKPTPIPTRPVTVPITPIAGGMLVPTPAATVPQPTSQPTAVVTASTETPQPAQPFDQTSPTPTAAAPTESAAQRALSAIPTLRNGPVCACNGDTYSCRELGDQAQACFDYCVARGQGDVHRLDFNQNGVACEE